VVFGFSTGCSGVWRWRPKTVLLHVESISVAAMLRWLKTRRIQARLAINTATPVTVITPFAKNISGVHVMMGPIGKYGSALESEMWLRVKYFAEAFPRGVISVDVGINPSSWKTAQRYGALQASVGSYLFSQKNPSIRWKRFQNEQ
jgi:pentose-5-phosphate-3-epimerase